MAAFKQRAAAIVREAAASTRDGLLTSLDSGEQALWAHALTRLDAWVLCGPIGRACASASVSAAASAL